MRMMSLVQLELFCADYSASSGVGVLKMGQCIYSAAAGKSA